MDNSASPDGSFKIKDRSKSTPGRPAADTEPAPNTAPLFFYGWVVVAIGFITLGVVFGVWYSFSVFILAIIKEFGWSRAAASSIFSVFVLCHALMAPLAGYLQDRFGPRIVIPTGAVLLSASLVATSRSHSLWHFLIAYGMCAGTGASLMGFASHAAFIPRWFERKRGLAVGIAMSGIGFGMLFLIPAAEMLISILGWRSAYICIAGVVLLLVGPLNLLFSRHRPEDMNLSPDGDGGKTATRPTVPSMVMQTVDAEWAGRHWTLSRAIRTRRFWFLVLAFIFLSFAYQGTLLHAVAAMVDNGIERTVAAYYFGILGIAGSGGKITLGYLSDVYGRERINTLGVSLSALGIVCLIAASSVSGPLPLLFALAFGLGYGAAAPLLPSVSADIFLGRSFGVIFALISIGGGIGGASGSYTAGMLRDVFGSYIPGLALFIVSMTLSCIFIWLASPRKIRRMVRSTRSDTA